MLVEQSNITPVDVRVRVPVLLAKVLTLEFDEE